MNEGFKWGGNLAKFYYEESSGAIMGSVEKNPDGTWKAKNNYDGNDWNYIDEIFAKQAVERKIRLMLIPEN